MDCPKTILTVIAFFALSTCYSLGQFIKNRGQVTDQYGKPRGDILAYGESSTMALYLRNDGVSYQLLRPEAGPGKAGPVIDVYRVDIIWKGSNPNADILYEESIAGVQNFYTTPYPDGILGVPSFGSIVYKDIYKGIDLKWYFRDGNAEYDFIVSPNAEYKDIVLAIEGASGLQIDNEGRLQISTPLGDILESKPVLFQDDREHEIRWLLNENIATFKIGQVDRKKLFTIDPVIVARKWGTYYGSYGLGDKGYDVTTDEFSNVFICGVTNSNLAIATSGAHDWQISGTWDAFLTKFDSNGTRLWGTYYGSTGDEIGYACSTDDFGNVYLVGVTTSIDTINYGWLFTPGAYQTALAGSSDAFIVKFNGSGVRQWGTYFGGMQSEKAYSCVVDDSLNVYVTGETSSSSGIASAGAYQTTYNSNLDAFLAKFSSTGSFRWATYFGGSGQDQGSDCATDSAGNVYLAGHTTSSTLIATTGIHQATYAGGGDAFLAKFTHAGILHWASYYGGTQLDFGYGCAIDKKHKPYLTGTTRSASGIATSSVFQPAIASSSYDDGFLVSFTISGQRSWSTYIGGTLEESAVACMVDDDFMVYVIGTTSSSSPSFAIGTSGSYKSSCEPKDAYLIKLDSTGNRRWGTYYGGSGNESALAAALDNSNNVYLSGTTNSTAGIATSGSHQSIYGGMPDDAFLVKLFECFMDSVYLVITSCGSLTSPGGNQIWDSSGTYIDTLQNSGGCDSILLISLTINSSSDTSLSIIACNSYILPSGRDTIYQSIVINDTLESMDGCDSTLNINVTINHVDTSVTINGHELKATAIGATYQWIDCDSASLIPGATGKSYLPNENGRYAVSVTQNMCTDTSACWNITSIGLSEFHLKNGIVLYPNPVTDELTIEIIGNDGTLHFEIHDQLGRIVREYYCENGNVLKADLSSLQDGYYFLKAIFPDGKSSCFKLLKN